MARRLAILCGLLAMSLAGWAALPPALRMDGVTMFPLRYIAEWFGATVRYQPAERMITLAVGLHTVRLGVNTDFATIDGRPVNLSKPATLYRDSTYVPVRFVAEALGARVDAFDDTGESGIPVVTVRNPANGDVLLLRVASTALEKLPPPTPAARAVLDAAARGEADTLARLLAATPALVNARDENRETPLFLAAQQGHLTCVTTLLRAGAQVTESTLDGRTPLHAAVEGGYDSLATLLITEGARFNAKNLLGQTPLHLAARAGRAEMVRTLLRYGAKAEAKDFYGQTPLIEAARAGDADGVTALLDAGAQVNAPDLDHYTPLHRAAAVGAVPVVTLLLQHGAVVTARTKAGRTPRDLAEAAGKTEAAQLLMQAGG